MGQPFFWGRQIFLARCRSACVRTPPPPQWGLLIQPWGWVLWAGRGEQNFLTPPPPVGLGSPAEPGPSLPQRSLSNALPVACHLRRGGAPHSAAGRAVGQRADTVPAPARPPHPEVCRRHSGSATPAKRCTLVTENVATPFFWMNTDPRQHWAQPTPSVQQTPPVRIKPFDTYVFIGHNGGWVGLI